MQQDPAHAPVNADQSWMDRINVAQIEAGRERWQALRALGMYDLPAGLARAACPVLFLMGEQFHYRKEGVDFSAGRAGIATKKRYAFGFLRQGFQRRPMPDAMPTRHHTRR
jgi:hypothetical protein